jgi:hypothetical protein
MFFNNLFFKTFDFSKKFFKKKKNSVILVKLRVKKGQKGGKNFPKFNQIRFFRK